MTKVQVQYDLLRPLVDADGPEIAKAHTVYGFLRVQPAPGLDKLNVEYDASRLNDKEVEASLVRLAIPIRRRWATP